MSGSSSAQLEMDGVEQGEAAVTRGAALRQEAAERLAEHRLRRGARHAAAAGEAVPTAKRPGKRAGVAQAVAERYAHSPSYRAMLAEEARLAAERAAAEAAVAARTAETVAEAHEELLAELALWNALQSFTAETAETVSAWPVAIGPIAVTEVSVSRPVAEVSTGGITVKLYEDLPRTPVDETRLRRNAAAHRELGSGEAEAFEDEIAFRQAPVFDDFRSAGPVEPIAANLLEFPRQLIAAKKARPRYAEGPLREEGPQDWEPQGSQLRIFEVGAQLTKAEPEPVSVLPEWSSIWLDAQTVTPVEPAADDDTALLPSLLPPLTAPVSLRMMAAAVDGLLVGAAVVGFVALAAKFARGFPSGVGAGITIGMTFALLYVLYHFLFFSLSGQTPGMRYARIGLCTFTDENPSRAAMCMRVPAMIVAVTPLGLGLLWVWLDDDRLGWHDRMSRMYQRAY